MIAKPEKYDYRIMYDTRLSRLAQGVLNHQKVGYHTVGGIAVSIASNGERTFYQAMEFRPPERS